MAVHNPTKTSLPEYKKKKKRQIIKKKKKADNSMKKWAKRPEQILYKEDIPMAKIMQRHVSIHSSSRKCMLNPQ